MGNVRKLKWNRKFKPVSVDSGDELFANGIFVFNVTKMLALIQTNPDIFPVEQIDVDEIEDYAAGDELSQETVAAADVSNPVILAEIRPGHFNVIDGNHRVERARRDGVKRIPARRIEAKHHIPFLTSTQAYEAYVRYWNEKVDRL